MNHLLKRWCDPKGSRGQGFGDLSEITYNISKFKLNERYSLYACRFVCPKSHMRKPLTPWILESFFLIRILYLIDIFGRFPYSEYDFGPLSEGNTPPGAYRPAPISFCRISATCLANAGCRLTLVRILSMAMLQKELDTCRRYCVLLAYKHIKCNKNIIKSMGWLEI